MKFIKFLKEIGKKDIAIAGGKGASLGEMTNVGIPVPPGFVVSAEAFEKFLEKSDINIEINAMRKRINFQDLESVEENSEILRGLILKAEIPKDIKEEILNAFGALNAKYVAVRSSATAEDSKIDSWAGQLETYLNITKENLIGCVKKCWASLYTPRALFYRAKKGLKSGNIFVAVVVQKMVQSEIAGVCFSVHPVTKDKDQMVIEACWGLGESLVQGIVTPDTYVIQKSNLKILDINKGVQEKMFVKLGGKTKESKVSKLGRNKQKLSESQIKEIARLCIKIEKHYKEPQDIEWALENGKFYIVQSRPITTLSERGRENPPVLPCRKRLKTEGC